MSETDTEVIPKLCRYLYHKLGTKLPFPKVRAGRKRPCTSMRAKSMQAGRPLWKGDG